MIGAWAQYPRHIPEDGELIVVIEYDGSDIESFFRGHAVVPRVVMFKGCYIYDAHGGLHQHAERALVDFLATFISTNLKGAAMRIA